MLEDSPVDQIIIPEHWDGLRIDKILALQYQNVHSRNYFQILIEKGNVFLNGTAIEKKRIAIPSGSLIEIHFEQLLPPDVKPEAIPLDVIYEDEHIIVVNKPVGMVVHPAPGHWSGTFVNALMHHCNLEMSGDTLRPGIVHRLDKDTSGLMVAGKTALSHRLLVEMFAAREVDKEYLALCVGNPGERNVTAPIGRHPVERQKMAVREEGKAALTEFRTLSTKQGISLVMAKLHTGRTHQIRVHLQHIGCPLLGDALYGSDSFNRRYGIKRQMLLAKNLRFRHPILKQELEFSVPLPEDMQTLKFLLLEKP